MNILHLHEITEQELAWAKLQLAKAHHLHAIELATFKNKVEYYEDINRLLLEQFNWLKL